MWNEYNYINIREVLSRVTRHPLMQDISLEAGIQYTIDFIGIMGLILGPIVLIILKNIFAKLIDRGIIKTIMDRT